MSLHRSIIILWASCTCSVACLNEAKTANGSDMADAVGDSSPPDTSTTGDDTDDATGIGVETTVATDTTPDDGLVPNALYEPVQRYEVQVTRYDDAVSYIDAVGKRRVVPIAVYTPLDAPLPAPVVLLSHGGAEGKTNPLKSMEHWAPVIAAAGYVAIAIAHVPRDDASYAALCESLGVPTDVAGYRCGLKLNWERPNDVAAVLDRLAAGGDAPWAAALDLGHVAHVGHSAGAGATLMSGGVSRNFVCAQPFGMDQGSLVPCDAADLVALREPRVHAIVSLSPQGPGSDGFMPTSFATLSVPMMMATGANDGDPGEPETRRAAYDLAPPGERWRVYLDDQGAKHTLFEASLDACEAITSHERCLEMRRWVFSSVLAFLGAQLRDDARARAWLGSDALEAVSAGTATLDAK